MRVQDYRPNVLSFGAVTGTQTIDQQRMPISTPGMALVGLGLEISGTGFDLSDISRIRVKAGSDVFYEMTPLQERQFLERFSFQAGTPASGSTDGITLWFNDLRSPGEAADWMSAPHNVPLSLEIVVGVAPTNGVVSLCPIYNIGANPQMVSYRVARPLGITAVSSPNNNYVIPDDGNLLAWNYPYPTNFPTRVQTYLNGLKIFEGSSKGVLLGESDEANYQLAASIADAGANSGLWVKCRQQQGIPFGVPGKSYLLVDTGSDSLVSHDLALWYAKPQVR